MIEDIANSHGLSQIINQPTNFEPNKKPSCIDLIFSSQTGLVTDSGTLTSLSSQCHHNIVFAKIALHVQLPKPYKRKMWDYKSTDMIGIRKALCSINWNRGILHKKPENEVEFLSNSILNAFSNFCPNIIITCRFKDKPWMTSEIKLKLKEKAKIYKKYVKNGYSTMYKQELEQKTKETSELIIASKEKYFQEQGNKLLDPTIGPKKYCSILNTFLQKNKITIIPPLWENGNFVNDYSIKANIFNDYFVSQRTLLEGPSTLPPFQLRTTHSLSALLISKNFILENIRALNQIKPVDGTIFLQLC